MDRNSIIGLLLIFLIIMGYSWYTQPSQEDLARMQAEKDSIALVEQAAQNELKQQQDSIVTETPETIVLDSSELASEYGKFARHANREVTLTTIANDKINLTISNKGAMPIAAILKEFSRADSSKGMVNLLDSQNARFAYTFSTKERAVNTADYFWDVADKTENSVSMRMYYGSDSKYLEQKYELTEGDYKVKYTFNVVGMQDDLPTGNSYMSLNIANKVPLQEGTTEAENMVTTIYYKYLEDSPDYISETSTKKEDLEEKTQWVSFKQQFFNTTYIPNEAFKKGGTIETTDGDTSFVKGMETFLTIPYNHTPSESFGMNIYMGPNKYYTLKEEGVDLQRIVPLGPVIIREINRVVIYLFDLLKKVTNSYGIIILLLTLIIKTTLFPLVYKSYKSMAKMRVLKPEIDAIKEKHEGDMQTIQQENMKLYKSAGVNPAGGCLPMLIQMPVLFAVFRFFPSAFELRQQSFLWAHDLSRYDSIFKLGFEIPFYGDHVSLFTLLMTVTTLVYTRFNNQMSGATGQMKWIGYLMPIMFLGFFNNYASGLTYYYFISTLITFTQQILIRRFFIDEDKIKLQIAENKKNPKKKAKSSNFQKKLEEMAKQQQEKKKRK